MNSRLKLQSIDAYALSQYSELFYSYVYCTLVCRETAVGSLRTDGPARGRVIVAHLVPSDVGMWSAFWHAPAVYLWDIHNYTLKTEIVSK